MPTVSSPQSDQSGTYFAAVHKCNSKFTKLAAATKVYANANFSSYMKILNSTFIDTQGMFYKCLDETCPPMKSLLLENFVCTKYEKEAKCKNGNSFMMSLDVMKTADPTVVDYTAYYCINDCFEFDVTKTACQNPGTVDCTPEYV